MKISVVIYCIALVSVIAEAKPGVGRPKRKPGQVHRNVCRLPMKIGPCKKRTIRYFFDSRSGNCKKFLFGGCQRNGNNFRTHSDCLRRCGCRAPMKVGHCRGTSRRYYYKSGRCLPFLFSGCGGNSNNFKTIRDCNAACKVASKMRLGKNGMPIRCNMRRKTGICRRRKMIPRQRFYYDVKCKCCKPYMYRGCSGGGNNFLTIETCHKICIKEKKEVRMYADLSSKRYAPSIATKKKQLKDLKDKQNVLRNKPPRVDALVMTEHFVNISSGDRIRPQHTKWASSSPKDNTVHQENPFFVKQFISTLENKPEKQTISEVTHPDSKGVNTLNSGDVQGRMGAKSIDQIVKMSETSLFKPSKETGPLTTGAFRYSTTESPLLISNPFRRDQQGADNSQSPGNQDRMLSLFNSSQGVNSANPSGLQHASNPFKKDQQGADNSQSRGNQDRLVSLFNSNQGVKSSNPTGLQYASNPFKRDQQGTDKSQAPDNQDRMVSLFSSNQEAKSTNSSGLQHASQQSPSDPLNSKFYNIRSGISHSNPYQKSTKQDTGPIDASKVDHPTRKRPKTNSKEFLGANRGGEDASVQPFIHKGNSVALQTNVNNLNQKNQFPAPTNSNEKHSSVSDKADVGFAIHSVDDTGRMLHNDVRNNQGTLNRNSAVGDGMVSLVTPKMTNDQTQTFQADVHSNGNGFVTPFDTNVESMFDANSVQLAMEDIFNRKMNPPVEPVFVSVFNDKANSKKAHGKSSFPENDLNQPHLNMNIGSISAIPSTRPKEPKFHQLSISKDIVTTTQDRNGQFQASSFFQQDRDRNSYAASGTHSDITSKKQHFHKSSDHTGMALPPATIDKTAFASGFSSNQAPWKKKELANQRLVEVTTVPTPNPSIRNTSKAGGKGTDIDMLEMNVNTLLGDMTDTLLQTVVNTNVLDQSSTANKQNEMPHANQEHGTNPFNGRQLPNDAHPIPETTNTNLGRIKDPKTATHTVNKGISENNKPTHANADRVFPMNSDSRKFNTAVTPSTVIDEGHLTRGRSDNMYLDTSAIHLDIPVDSILLNTGSILKSKTNTHPGTLSSNNAHINSGPGKVDRNGRPDSITVSKSTAVSNAELFTRSIGGMHSRAVGDGWAQLYNKQVPSSNKSPPEQVSQGIYTERQMLGPSGANSGNVIRNPFQQERNRHGGSPVGHRANVNTRLLEPDFNIAAPNGPLEMLRKDNHAKIQTPRLRNPFKPRGTANIQDVGPDSHIAPSLNLGSGLGTSAAENKEYAPQHQMHSPLADTTKPEKGPNYDFNSHSHGSNALRTDQAVSHNDGHDHINTPAINNGLWNELKRDSVSLTSQAIPKQQVTHSHESINPYSENRKDTVSSIIGSVKDVSHFKEPARQYPINSGTVRTIGEVKTKSFPRHENTQEQMTNHNVPWSVGPSSQIVQPTNHEHLFGNPQIGPEKQNGPVKVSTSQELHSVTDPTRQNQIFEDPQIETTRHSSQSEASTSHQFINIKEVQNQNDLFVDSQIGTVKHNGQVDASTSHQFHSIAKPKEQNHFFVDPNVERAKHNNPMEARAKPQFNKITEPKLQNHLFVDPQVGTVKHSGPMDTRSSRSQQFQNIKEPTHKIQYSADHQFVNIKDSGSVYPASHFSSISDLPQNLDHSNTDQQVGANSVYPMNTRPLQQANNRNEITNQNRFISDHQIGTVRDNGPVESAIQPKLFSNINDQTVNRHIGMNNVGTVDTQTSPHFNHIVKQPTAHTEVNAHSQFGTVKDTGNLPQMTNSDKQLPDYGQYNPVIKSPFIQGSLDHATPANTHQHVRDPSSSIQHGYDANGKQPQTAESVQHFSTGIHKASLDGMHFVRSGFLSHSRKTQPLDSSGTPSGAANKDKNSHPRNIIQEQPRLPNNIDKTMQGSESLISKPANRGPNIDTLNTSGGKNVMIDGSVKSTSVHQGNQFWHESAQVDKTSPNQHLNGNNKGHNEVPVISENLQSANSGNTGHFISGNANEFGINGLNKNNEFNSNSHPNAYSSSAAGNNMNSRSFDQQNIQDTWKSQPSSSFGQSDQDIRYLETLHTGQSQGFHGNGGNLNHDYGQRQNTVHAQPEILRGSISTDHAPDIKHGGSTFQEIHAPMVNRRVSPQWTDANHMDTLPENRNYVDTGNGNVQNQNQQLKQDSKANFDPGLTSSTEPLHWDRRMSLSSNTIASGSETSAQASDKIYNRPLMIEHSQGTTISQDFSPSGLGGFPQDNLPFSNDVNKVPNTYGSGDNGIEAGWQRKQAGVGNSHDQPHQGNDQHSLLHAKESLLPIVNSPSNGNGNINPDLNNSPGGNREIINQHNFEKPPKAQQASDATGGHSFTVNTFHDVNNSGPSSVTGTVAKTNGGFNFRINNNARSHGNRQSENGQQASGSIGGQQHVANKGNTSQKSGAPNISLYHGKKRHMVPFLRNGISSSGNWAGGTFFRNMFRMPSKSGPASSSVSDGNKSRFPFKRRFRGRPGSNSLRRRYSSGRSLKIGRKGPPKKSAVPKKETTTMAAEGSQAESKSGESGGGGGDGEEEEEQEGALYNLLLKYMKMNVANKINEKA